MGKKRVFLYGAALVLAGCVGLAGFRLASGQELYKAPELTLLEGQAGFDPSRDLLQGIEYDAGQYELSVDDLGGFDVDQLGEYWVGYVLTPKAGEQADLLPVAQAAELPEGPDPVTGADPDPVTGADPTPEPAVDPTPEPVVDPTPEPVVDPTPEPVVDPTQDPGAVETEPPVETQDPGAVETEPPVETQDPGAVETEPPVETQDPDAVETELPLETPQPEAVHFKRLVIVKPAIRYEETLRMELGDPAGAAKGITAETDNYGIRVESAEFNPDEVDEYKVIYTLVRQDTQKVLRQFERWVQVTLPDVEFPVYEPALEAPADPAAAEMEFWLEGITYNENRYTLRLRSDPADLEPNCDQPQRLVYELWEGDPAALPAVDAASAMYADPSAGGFDAPSAGDGPQSVEVGLQPAGDGDPSAPKLAAVFGRDVYTTGEMEEPKESEKPEDRTLAIVAPPLVIYLEDLDPDNPEPIDLLDGVEVIDEATGDPVADAVVAVSDPGGLLDAVVDNTGGSGLFSNGMDGPGPGMGDPGMDGPGPGAGDPVPAEPENTGYNILDPTALTEGEYKVELTAADPETGELVTGVRSVSVQPRAVPSGTGFAIGFSDRNAYDSVDRVAWVDYHMINNGNPTDSIWDLDRIHTRLRSAIDEFNTILSPNGYMDPDTNRKKWQAVNTTGHLTIYIFGNVTLTQDDVDALKAFTFTRSNAAINNPSQNNTGVYLEWTDAELRFHNAPGARLSFANNVNGLELPEGVNLPQGFYWNVVTSGNKYIAGVGGRRLTMAPREYGNGRLIMTGGPSRYGGSSVSTNFTYAGVKGAGNSGTPTHVVAAGLLYKDIGSTGDWRNSGTLTMAVTPSSGINVQTIMTHALFVANGTYHAHPGQDGRVDVTLNSGSGETDVYLGYTNVNGSSNRVEVGNYWCNLYLANGARARNVYGRAMAYNAVGAANTSDVGDMTNGLWVETRSGSSQITSLNGFHGLKMVNGSTLTCGNLDYANYGDGSWGGEVQLEANATLILTNRNATQKAGKLIVFGANATLAVPTENNNSVSATPLVLDKNPATSMSTSNKLTLRGSQTGYSGKRNDVVLRFTHKGQANKNLYNLHSSLSNVERFEQDTNAGTVYLVSDDRWQAYYEENGTYRLLGNYLTLGNALTAMKGDAAANNTHRNWRFNMIMDYTLNDNDRTTLSRLTLQNVDQVILDGKTAGGAQRTFTVGQSFLRFPQGNGTGTEYVMRDFKWESGGSPSAIIANGSKLIIEGQWSGTEKCHVAGGAGETYGSGDEAQRTITHNGATDVTVRNTGSGWASIVGGNLLLRDGGKNVYARSIVNGATRVTVHASWPVGLGISPACASLGYDCEVTLGAGGTANITGSLQRGTYTSQQSGTTTIQGHISHVGFTDTIRVRTFTANGDVTINLGSDAAALSTTNALPVNAANYTRPGVSNGDFLSYTNNPNENAYPKGSGRLILSVNNDLTLASGTQIKLFDELRVAAGKKLTIEDRGGNVNYSGRAGKLVLGADSTVQLNTAADQDNGSTLKLGGITLNGNATFSFPWIGNRAWAPVRVTKADGQLTANGHKLTLTYNPNRGAVNRDVVLEFASADNAAASVNHLTSAFTNGAVFVQDGTLVRVDREIIALDYAEADGTPSNLNSYTSYASLKEAIDQFKADTNWANWRISLLQNYTLTEEDARALTSLGTRLNEGGLQRVYLAGRRLDSDTINTLTLGRTFPSKILRLPEGNAGAAFVMKDFHVSGSPGAIVANGRRLTIEGAWDGTGWWYVVGGKADWYEATGDTTLTYNGTTNLTVKNTGSGWAAIAGGNLVARGDGGTERPAAGTASSTVTGATNLTVHAADWGTHYGITPGCLYIGCNVNTTTLTAGGTATLTGKVNRGHIAHFAAVDRGEVGACVLGGDSVINLGSAPDRFTIGSGAEMNVKTHGAISGGHKLILSVNGECLVEDGSNVMKTFDELRVSENQTLTFAGDGGWIKHNNREGLLVLKEGSTLKLSRIGSGVGSALHVRGVRLDGNANLQYLRMNGTNFAPLVVDSGGTLTAATGKKLTVSYLDSNNQAELGDCLLYFVTQDNAAPALPYVGKGFTNASSVALVIEGGVIKVGMGRVLLTCYDGTYGQYFSTLAEALADIETRTDVPGAQSLVGRYRSLARITFVEDYTLTAEDVEALKTYRWPGQWTDGPNGTKLMLTSQFSAGAQVPKAAGATDNWPVLNYPTPAGTAVGSTVRRAVTIPADITEILLGITNHVWEQLDLRFEGDDTEIFVNGWKLYVNAGVNMLGGHYPTLYGGGKDAVIPYNFSYNTIGGTSTFNKGGNVGIDLYSGTWKNVYGGGRDSTAIVPGSTNIMVNGAGLAAGGAVYGGGKDGPVNGNTNVTITSGSAAGGTPGVDQVIKIVAGGKNGNVTGAANLTVNGGVASTEITIQGVESGTAGSTNINVNLGNNLPSTASNVTLNVYAGPRTEAKTGGNVPADNVVDSNGYVTGDANASIYFAGPNRPNLGTVCGLKKDVNSTNNVASKGALTLKGTMNVKEVIFFETLNIGDNSVNTGAVTVTGRLDSDPNKNRVQSNGNVYLWPFDRSGSLILKGEQRLNLPDQPADMAGVPNNETGEAKVGKLITTSNQAHLHIGRRKTAVNQEGRGIGATNPLYVTLENGTANLTAHKLRVGTPQGTPHYGEILITFPRPMETGATVAPSKDHYQTDTEGWILSLKESRFNYTQGQTNVLGNRNTSNIIYAKSIKLSIEVVKVTPTRAEDTSLVSQTDASQKIGWTVELEMLYYKNDGHNNFVPDTTVTQPPQELYVDTSPLHDEGWFEGTGGLPATALANTTTFAAKPGAAGVFTATITIPPQVPFTYGKEPGAADAHYFVHCKGEHNSAPDVRSVALDLHAPQLTGGDVTSTSNGQGVTEFTVTAGDVIPHNAPQGEIYADETHSAYAMSNMTLMAWSVEEKRLPTEVNKAYFDGLAAGHGEVMFYDADGTQNPTTMKFTVNKAQLPDPDADAIYVYLQDRLGNTRIVPVVLSMHQLDLEIPTRVGVVLVKNGRRTLSPICKITNRSKPYVQVDLVGYTAQTTNQHSLGQTLVNNTTIGLAIGNSGETDSIGSSINVQDLPWRPYASLPTDGFTGGLRRELAILGPRDGQDMDGNAANRGNTLTFMFQGNFNQDTELSDRWNLFYLTYRFTVTDRPNDAAPNP